MAIDENLYLHSSKSLITSQLTLRLYIESYNAKDTWGISLFSML